MSDTQISVTVVIRISSSNGDEVREVILPSPGVFNVQGATNEAIATVLATGRVRGAVVLDGALKAQFPFSGGKALWHANMPDQNYHWVPMKLPPEPGEAMQGNGEVALCCARCKSFTFYKVAEMPQEVGLPRLEPSIVCPYCKAHYYARIEPAPTG